MQRRPYGVQRAAALCGFMVFAAAGVPAGQKRQKVACCMLQHGMFAGCLQRCMLLHRCICCMLLQRCVSLQRCMVPVGSQPMVPSVFRPEYKGFVSHCTGGTVCNLPPAVTLVFFVHAVNSNVSRPRPSPLPAPLQPTRTPLFSRRRLQTCRHRLCLLARRRVPCAMLQFVLGVCGRVGLGVGGCQQSYA